MKYLKMKDVCEIFEVDRTTIYHWMNNGMPSIKIGGGRRFVKDQIDRWIAKGVTIDTTAEYVQTPCGRGRLISFDNETGKVTVEMDYQYLVDFQAKDCYEIGGK